MFIQALVAKGKKALSAHAEEKARVTQESVALTKEINQLRRELQVTRAQHRLKTAAQQQQQQVRGGGGSGTQRQQQQQQQAAAAALQQQVERQHEQIRALKNQLMVFDAQIAHDDGAANAGQRG